MTTTHRVDRRAVARVVALVAGVLVCTFVAVWGVLAAWTGGAVETAELLAVGGTVVVGRMVVDLLSASRRPSEDHAGR